MKTSNTENANSNCKAGRRRLPRCIQKRHKKHPLGQLGGLKKFAKMHRKERKERTHSDCFGEQREVAKMHSREISKYSCSDCRRQQENPYQILLEMDWFEIPKTSAGKDREIARLTSK